MAEVTESTTQLPKWVTGIIAGVALAAITGTGATLFTLSNNVAALQATQIQMIKTIDLMLEAHVNPDG